MRWYKALPGEGTWGSISLIILPIDATVKVVFDEKGNNLVVEPKSFTLKSLSSELCVHFTVVQIKV